MRIDSTGRLPVALATSRAVLAGLVLAAVAACTTVEGTNALTDVGTFEREVMTSTLQGLGAVPREGKEPLAAHRGPLVLPKSTAALPPPQSTDVAAAQLPEDSSTVAIDMSRVSEEDLRRLKAARVVDLRTMSGRPLTEAETRQLTARFQGAQIKGQRSLIIPPDEYFTVVDGTELICLADDGSLVPITDRRCPTAIRRALSNKVTSNGTLGEFDFGQ